MAGEWTGERELNWLWRSENRLLLWEGWGVGGLLGFQVAEQGVRGQRSQSGSAGRRGAKVTLGFLQVRDDNETAPCLVVFQPTGA